MVSVEIQLHNPSGLHLRPAGILCKAATKFQSHVAIRTADGILWLYFHTMIQI